MRGEPKFSRPDIDAIISYVTSLQPGGPPIPTVDLAGDLLRVSSGSPRMGSPRAQNLLRFSPSL